MNSKKITLSVLLASALAFTACSTDTKSALTVEKATADLETAKAATTTALTEAATKGTVVTIADGYGTGCKVTSGTLTAQEITTTVGQYLFLGDPAAALSATECTDAHTGIALPPLSAPTPTGTDDLDTVIITPITTVTQSFVAAGLGIADAKAATTALTGVVAENLEKDPVQTPAIQQAVAEVVAIAKLTTTATVTDPIAEIVKEAKGESTTGIEAGQDLTKASTTLNPAAANAVVAIIQAIKDAGNPDTTGLQEAVAKIVKVSSSETATTDLTDKETIKEATAKVTVEAKGITTVAVTPETITTVAAAVVKTVEEAIDKGEDIASITNVEAVTTAVAAETAAETLLDNVKTAASGA